MPTASVGRVLVIVMFRSGTRVESWIGPVVPVGRARAPGPPESVELDQDSNALSMNWSTLSLVTTGA